MSGRSTIEWTEYTWNPLTGCTKVSPGCKNCYADRMARRLQAMRMPKYARGFQLALHRDILHEPLKWKKPRVVFVNSMSDMFHEDVPSQFIADVYDVMAQAHWHTFQVLTKRSQRLAEVSPKIRWAPNIWMGVSVESEKYLHRIDHLRETDACVKFLSIEPLLGPLPGLDVSGIDWVIVGGESGPRARPVDEDWVVEIRDCCLRADVPFFFKQWGGTRKKESGRVLQGTTWDQMPVAAAC